MSWGSLSLRLKTSENCCLASPTFHSFVFISWLQSKNKPLQPYGVVLMSLPKPWNVQW
jgi:hypothetical protein